MEFLLVAAMCMLTGGLIRTCSGVWYSGFAANLSICSVFTAECWGVLYGLCLAWQRGFRCVILVWDMCLINMLKKKVVPPMRFWGIFLDILKMLELQWEVRINHVRGSESFC
ncbi:hypothetical protein RCOM_0850580 [Ricinus communis]|uniref:RNase H type-1 domain-containing protein n=1 Tax=Ricinus communis TaxID=3988 RepID=B9RUT1_RICCO|nr:hypothetical protein RCOM_0850580 [Ricinus communis]